MSILLLATFLSSMGGAAAHPAPGLAVAPERAPIPAVTLHPFTRRYYRMLQAIALGLWSTTLAGQGPAPSRVTIVEGSPIVSLDAADYSDLEPLRQAIGDARIVMLGESSHGVREYTRLKERLVRLLHDEMGFTVLAFESPLFGCGVSNRLRSDVEPSVLMRACLWGIWHTEEYVDLMEAVQARAGTLRITGIDNQPGPADRSARRHLFTSILDPLDADYAARVGALEEQFWTRLASRPRQERPHETFGTEWRQMVQQYDALASYLRDLAGREFDVERRRMLLFAAQVALSNGRYVSAVSTENQVARAEVRDRAMSDNLRFLAETLYPGERIILWAHNAHIARENEVVDYPAGNFPAYRSLGGNFAVNGIPTYSLALFARRGQMASNSRRIITITPPTATSLEGLPVPENSVAVFFDLKDDGPAARALASVTIKDWGDEDVPMNLPRQFDGVILLDEVRPPDYWQQPRLYDPNILPLP